MRLISPRVPHRCSGHHSHRILSSSAPSLLLASYFYSPHNKKKQHPTSSSASSYTLSSKRERSLYTRARATATTTNTTTTITSSVDVTDTSPNRINLNFRLPTPTSRRLRRNSGIVRTGYCKLPSTPSVVPPASLSLSTCSTRRYASSLSSVTGLTQELIRITAFRHSSGTAARAVDFPMGAPTPTADHLVVLVHGLWGNPSHMEYMAETLRQRYDDSRLIVHVAAKNSGNYTYDGIELGGERLAGEIEELLDELAERGVRIKKFSIVGYSLGGLVSRYVVGVLHSKGIFDKITPVNFTTFASPHLGVRTPKLGFHNHIWNVIGARTLSASGRQLFTIDHFRDTKRPLLAVLADKELPFWKALNGFKNKVLYANIINDRSTNFFTSGISSSDPFADLETVEYKYLPGYNNVLIDAEAGVQLKSPPSLFNVDSDDNNDDGLNNSSGNDGARRGVGVEKSSSRTFRDFLHDLPFIALYAVLVPVGFCFFLVNAGVQTYSSSKRIRLHARELRYNIPLTAAAIVDGVQERVDEVLEGINAAQTADNLPTSASSASTFATTAEAEEGSSGNAQKGEKMRLEDTMEDMPEFPKLALAPYQFDMIDNLDQLGFKKFPVHIHKVKHSHAAIIVRNPKNEGFSEGKIVIKHWLDEQFEV
ncbi:hypothetical protein TWF694_003474 [Orbilia ellipsospora]|uniref:DUF676 domain-containing protein n=1 Tax=Orbilia ellipsospora TaxID=2528407 RepID=A0AAV9WY55_9PEZI